MAGDRHGVTATPLAGYTGNPVEEEVTCAVCPVSFPNRDAYLPHTKTGWHDCNTKRKMRGQKPLTEEEWTKEFGPKPAPEPAAAAAPEPEEAPRAEEAEALEPGAEEVVPKEVDAVEEQAPPGDDEVDACIIFDYKGERWNHRFRVAKGCTVFDVKRAMVKSDSPEQDAVSFDLQKRRVRLNNYDTVDQTETFEFVYIGPEEGQKRKERDKELKAQRDEQSRQFRMRSEMAQRDEPREPVSPKMKSPDAPAGDLVITVTIDPDLDLTNTMKVARGTTVLALKRLIAAGDPTGEMRPHTFGLRLPETAAALPDGTVLTERHLRLLALDLEASDPAVDGGQTKETEAADLEEDPPCDESGPNVVVYLHHLDAKPLQGKTLAVTVPKTVNIRYLRRSACNKIGRRCIADVTVHKKGGTSMGQSSWPRMEDDELLGELREFFTRGANLIAAAVPLERAPPKAAQAAAPSKAADPKAKGIPAPKKIAGGLDFLVTHDTADQTLEVCMPKGKTVMDLKRAICDRVLRGPYTKIVLADSGGKPLDEAVKLDPMSFADRQSIRLAGLDIGLPVTIELRVVHGETPSKVTKVSVDDTSNIADVRKALLAKHGGKPADVKIALAPKKQGTAVASAADGMRLNGKRELFAVGPLMDNIK